MNPQSFCRSFRPTAGFCGGLALFLVAALWSALAAGAATHTWTGGAPVTAGTAAANWAGGAPPQLNNDIVLPAGAAGLTKPNSPDTFPAQRPVAGRDARRQQANADAQGARWSFVIGLHYTVELAARREAANWCVFLAMTRVQPFLVSNL